VLFACRRADGTTYWRVRLQTGEWTWPDHLVVDGVGDTLNPECASCGLPFVMRCGSGELICARCDAEQFGGAVRANEPPAPRRFEDVPAHRRRRT
jgi:hypothetical protein